MSGLHFRRDSFKVAQDSISLAHFGRLCNYRSVEYEKLCPTGWHVRTEDEWDALIESVDCRNQKKPGAEHTLCFFFEVFRGNAWPDPLRRSGQVKLIEKIGVFVATE